MRLALIIVLAGALTAFAQNDSPEYIAAHRQAKAAMVEKYPAAADKNSPLYAALERENAYLQIHNPEFFDKPDFPIRLIARVMEQRPELFTPHPTAAPRELSKSTRLFYVALAELKKADERPEGISSGENVKRIEPMMKQIISAGDSIDRKDLNTLYPGLGDHFLDDAVVHARSLLDAVSNRNADSWDKAMAAFIRWQTWWSVHQDGVREVVAGK